MLEARCPKCGYHCYGWALTEPEHQACPKCGARLEIYQEKTKNETSHTRQDPDFANIFPTN